MEDLKWLFKKYGILFAVLLIVIILICVMYNRHEEQNGVSEADSCETDIEKTENDELSEEERWRKGYDLPIEEEKRKRPNELLCNYGKFLRHLHSCRQGGCLKCGSVG